MKTLKLNKAGDLDISAEPSAIIGAVLMIILLSAGAFYLLHLSLISSIIAGFTGTMLHFYSEYFHQMGHASAAKRTGHPMTGMVFWGVLSRSVYPPDEPELPAETHITRALGGPISSAWVSVVGAISLGVVSLVSGSNPLIMAIFSFFFWDNLLIFTLGAFLPLGFTDGSTLLYWLPRRKK